jgi:GcrA cell cycle regulator
LPGVQRALAEERLQLVTEASAASSPEARVAVALRRDMQAAIAQAERAALEQLRRRRGEPEEGRSWTRWTAELDARLLQTDATGFAAMAAELGLSRRYLRMRRCRAGSGPPRKRKRRATDWPEAQTEQLRQAWEAGQSVAAIAAALGRSPGSVTSRVQRLGLTRPLSPR